MPNNKTMWISILVGAIAAMLGGAVENQLNRISGEGRFAVSPTSNPNLMVLIDTRTGATRLCTPERLENSPLISQLPSVIHQYDDIPQEAVRSLLTTPEKAGGFDQVFGEGRAAVVLDDHDVSLGGSLHSREPSHVLECGPWGANSDR